MPSDNKIIVAAAGAGKTTKIISNALSSPDRRTAIVTYTLNNVGEIKKKFYENNGFIPEQVSIIPWFTFLIQDLARPFQNFVYEPRIDSIAMVNGQSTRGIAKTDIKKYYFSEGTNIYTDKISEFACICNSASEGAVIKRLSRLYDHIYIDEAQDLAGYDLELLEILLRSTIGITLVGDPRQATLRTNYSNKNRQYVGSKIINKFLDWEKNGLCTINYLYNSFRCNQAICNLADSVYPEFCSTKSVNNKKTGHDGVFYIKVEQVAEYVASYKPQALRYNKKTDCLGLSALNFGESKGLTFDRVLIFPNNTMKKVLQERNLSRSKTRDKLYVGITRARYSVAFVID